MHTNGNATRVQLTGTDGLGTSRLQGPGFSVDLAHQSGEVQGDAAPEQVLRLLAREGCLASDGSPVLSVHVETTSGHDEYRYTADLRHRLLFRRAWDRDGRVGVFYGLNPFVADTDGPVGKVPNRASLRNVVNILSADGPVARIDVMNLFTFRSANASGLAASPSDRVAVPELEREVLAAADVVLLAWGSKVTHVHRAHVEQLLDVLDDVGLRPSMLQKDGELLVVGTPPQPAHPARLGFTGIRAVEVDRDDVLGAPTRRGPTVPASFPSATEEPSTMTDPGPATSAPVPAETDEAAELVAWASTYLDRLGTEAVRRYLAGTVVAGPRVGAGLPPLPSPLEVAREARTHDTAWGALRLAVVALRVADGVAWWKAAARYTLADTGTSRTKVSGTWGNAARSILEGLYGLEKGTADDAAHSGSSHDLTETARRWGVSASEAGTVFGPGAPKQFGADMVVRVDDASARPCYRMR
ncbi:MAG: DUF1643 domain-containing protein [Actinomycetes bacterium]